MTSNWILVQNFFSFLMFILLLLSAFLATHCLLGEGEEVKKQPKSSSIQKKLQMLHILKDLL